MPSLSICIPTRNRAAYLRDALAEIARQGGGDVEVVVSDNASTDDTEAVVAAARGALPRLVYHRWEENAGADRNFLKVVELAGGEYCWLFGDDDLPAPGAVAAVREALGKGADVVLVGIMLCDLSMNPLGPHPISDLPDGTLLDLADPAERELWFRSARTTTALFSFLSSIVVRRARWNEAVRGGEFVGSAWVHAARLHELARTGLRVLYLKSPRVLKRGDNDSFLEHGAVRRLGIAVDGFRRLGEAFYGAGSPEARHMMRTVRNEYTLAHLLHTKLSTARFPGQESPSEFRRVVRSLFDDGSAASTLRLLAVEGTPTLLLEGYKRLFGREG